MPKVALVSTPGNLGFSFLSAQSFIRIFAKKSFSGSRAIHVSRFKAVVIDAVQEIEKERNKLIEKYAVMEPKEEGEEPSIKADKDGVIEWKSVVDKLECQKAVEKMIDEVPVLINLNSPTLKIAANQIYGILTSDDCPEIPKGEDWFHNQIVLELEAAGMPSLEKK